MTFNVRYPAPHDGPNRWEFRRDLLVATILEKDSDLLGTQELRYEQAQYILDHIPAYAWLGLDRHGGHADEHMGVFYKRQLFTLLQSGHFWLSETPQLPGSMSWDIDIPRMVTWALFELKELGGRLYFCNTHFPHRLRDHQSSLRPTFG